MLRKLFTYRFSIAITLIVGISSVYICQGLCDFAIYSMTCATDNTVCDVSTLTRSNHKDSQSSSSNHHDSDKALDHDKQPDSGSENQHTNQDEDCCEVITTKVFESLFAQKINVLILHVKLFLVFEIEFPAYQATYNKLITDNFNFYSDSSPPTKNGGIYVLIQSFLL